MIFKKKFLIFALFIILSTQILLYFYNNQKNTFRFLIWNTKEITLGKLINISFLSGFLISTILNKTISTKTIISSKNEENFSDEPVSFIDEEVYKYENEIPPQRDIRDTQPTISVNYRVIKNNQDKYSQNDGSDFDFKKKEDDWDKSIADW